MRNVLVHRYFDVDVDMVRQVVKTDIPRLKSQVKDILENLRKEQ